jgi:hypothetical protein
MKVSITITGGINGNSHIMTQMAGYTNYARLNFNNGYIVHYDTKKEAVKSIRDAYNQLIQDEPERKNRLGGIRVNKDRTTLYYDATTATIEKIN